MRNTEMRLKLAKGKLPRKNCRNLLFWFIISGFVAFIYLLAKETLLYEELHNRSIFRFIGGLNFRMKKENECIATKWSELQTPFTALEIKAPCGFLDRIRLLNEDLTSMRQRIFAKEVPFISLTTSSNFSAPNEIQTVGGYDDNYTVQLAKFSQVTTVALPWYTLHDNSKSKEWSSCKDKYNLLIQDYFQWTADDELCKVIRIPGKTKHRNDVIYNRTCITDINSTIQKQSLNVLALNAKHFITRPKSLETGFPMHYYRAPPAFAMHFHIIRDGIVTPNSVVFSGNLKLVQYGCLYPDLIHSHRPNDISKIPFFDEVFPISQFWGTGWFHKMVENIPRIAPFVDFLKRNPQIKILAPDNRGKTREILDILGLNKSKIITGTCRAKLLYISRSVMCGLAGIQETQIVSNLFQNFIKSNLSVEKRNKVIVIRRSGRRKFKYQALIEEAVKNVTLAHHLDFVIFNDKHLPSLKKTMHLFYHAILVVAPHGAGLSNIIFSQPGTYIVEGVCNPPVVNLCYLRLSYILGHHWHGHLSKNGCQAVVNVSVESIISTVIRYLQIITSNFGSEKNQCI